MPNAASSQPVMRPVRPNRTTSASAITNGGVMIGRIDITFSRPAKRCPPRCTTSASTRPRSVDSTPTIVASSAELTATPQRVPPRRQSTRPDVGRQQPLRGERGREIALRVQDRGQQRLADREEDEQQQQRGNDDDDRGDRGIAAEHAPPRDRPREADRQREERQRRADAERGTAVAGGKPGADPPRDRHRGRARRESVAAPGGEQQRGEGRGEQRPEQRLAGNGPQQRRRSADAGPRHDGERGERNGRDDRRRAVARHRHEDGPRERGRGGRHLASRSAHFGSVETSLSHFVSRRERSADEPYLTKS